MEMNGGGIGEGGGAVRDWTGRDEYGGMLWMMGWSVHRFSYKVYDVIKNNIIMFQCVWVYRTKVEKKRRQSTDKNVRRSEKQIENAVKWNCVA